MLFADYFDDATAHVVCSRGHKSSIILQSPKFEILLDSAANAILEGYTLEGCATLYAAYERLIEFAIKVMCIKGALEEALISNIFKEVSVQSERQIGAFIFLYALNFSETYRPKRDIIEFRNKCIHKGYIPTKEETFDFADKIYCEISSIYKKLEDNFPEEVIKCITMGLKSRALKRFESAKASGIEYEWSTTVSSSFFMWARQQENKTFREALEIFDQNKKLMDGAKARFEALSKIILKK